jgi:hypothetical protein
MTLGTCVSLLSSSFPFSPSLPVALESGYDASSIPTLIRSLPSFQREMPVMGWIQGHFCVGIIDEIQRRPIPTPSPIVPSSSTSASIKATDALTSQSNKITSYFRPPAPASAASLLPSVDSAVIDLTGGSDEDEAMPSTRAKQEDAEGRRKKPTHALYVSDSKTRKTNTLPTAEASHAGKPKLFCFFLTARILVCVGRIANVSLFAFLHLPTRLCLRAALGKLQLQCYKLLLDALLRPASSPSSSSSSITGSSPLATLDPDALQPFTFLRLYAYLGLDSSAPFSPAFLAQTHVLIEGNQLGERAVARNLGELEFVWELAMDGLGVDRSKGCEEEMELVYRFQGAGKAKEKGARTRKGIGQGKGRGTDREAELIEQEEERLLRMALKASMETSTGGSEGELGEAVDGDGDAVDPVGENADLAMAVALSLLEDSTTPDRDEQAETDRTGPKALEGRMLLGGSIQADAYSSDGRSSTFEIDDGQDLVADTALEPGRSDTLNALSPVTAPASNSLSLIANRRIEKPRLPHPSSSAWGSASPSLLRPLRQPPFDSAPRRPTSSDPSNANYQPLESPARSACNLPDTPFTYSYLLSLPMSNLVSICVSESIPFLGTKHALAKRILKALPSTPSLSLPKDSPRWKDDGEGSSLSDGRSSKRARTNSASSAEKSAENEKRDPTDEDSSGSDSEPKDLLSSSPSPPSSPLTHSASVITSTNIIGRVPVRYSHSRLMDHITEVLEFWTGVRAPRGVSIENANRCDWCEYRDDCEWREKEVRPSLPRPILRLRILVGRLSLWKGSFADSVLILLILQGRRLWEAVRTKKQRGTSKEDSLLHEL